MTLAQKYGKWAVVFGSTLGAGEHFSRRLAKEGMNLVLVDFTTEEEISKFGDGLKEEFGIDYIPAHADFTQPPTVDRVFELTKDLELGFMGYIAGKGVFGKFHEVSWQDHERMLNLNLITFLKVFYHYVGLFAKQDRGAIITISSITAISSAPYIALYGAAKAFIKKLTEAVAYENEDTNVDILSITLGTMKFKEENKPQGPHAEAVIKAATKPEEVVEEAFSKLGKELSVIIGDTNKKNVKNWLSNHSQDEYIRYMGSFYKDK